VVSVHAPVRGTPPPRPPAPPPRRPRLPRLSLWWVGFLAAATLILLLLLGWSLVPHASGGHLRAPVATAFQGVCVSQPALCRAG
jgi:hypothetical protein